MALAAGTTLGHYEIVAKLGEGGMGEVYRALDTKLGRDVALKVLPSAFAGDPARIDRFKREARAVAALNHPHIVTIYSVEESDGVHFLTMELVEGETLEGHVPANGLPSSQILDIAWALADALSAAHGRGIVHRDLKPANVMVTREHRVKVLDFGLAKFAGTERTEPRESTEKSAAETMTSAAVTELGVVMGTIPYMSPEQVEGRAVDQRSDVFAMGAMLYELATGQRPFQGSSPAAVMSAILRDAPPAISTRRGDVPAEFGRLVDRCLEKDPGTRVQTAKEVRETIDSIRRSPASPASVPPAVPAPSEADRLADEGARVFRSGATGGPAARGSLDQAEIYFKRALAIEPNHAKALCEYATWYYMMSNLGFLPTEESTARGRQLIMAALAADDQAAETHVALGKLFLYVDDDFNAAIRHADRAVALGGTDTEALRLQSVVCKLQGRFDDAIEAARAATVLQPDAPMYWNALGDALLAAGRYPEALEALRAAISRQAGFGAAFERIELALVRLGRVDEAIDFRMARVRAAGDGARADQLLEESNRLGAEEARRRDLLRDVEQLLAEAAQSNPFARGWIRTTADKLILAYTELGDWTNAMNWIERSYTNRPGRVRRVLMDLPIDRKGLATEPRYARLLRVAGLDGI